MKMEKGAAAPAKPSLELPQMSCFTCKFIMGEGKRILEEDSTIDQLTKLSETICNDLKGDLKVEIESVNVWVDFIKDSLSQNILCDHNCYGFRHNALISYLCTPRPTSSWRSIS